MVCLPRGAAPYCGRTLKRFIHYRDRWEGHSASEKLESEQVDTIKQKIVSLEETMSKLAKDFAWLMQARASTQRPSPSPPLHAASKSDHRQYLMKWRPLDTVAQCLVVCIRC